MTSSLHSGALSFLLCATLAACSSSDAAKPARADSGDAGQGTGGKPAVDDGPVPTLPTATGTCPTFANGMVTFTVNGEERQAKIWIDDTAAAAQDGPLVIYWYGTGGTPDQVITNVVSVNPGIGQDNVDRITAKGGMVVAPVHIANGVFPWLATVAQDQALTDEIVACADAQVGIDKRHIHSLGFSAGGLFTANLSAARSNYLASVVTYSGGGNFANPTDPDNKFPAMIVFGGTADVLVLNFHDQSASYHDTLTQAGHFTFLCDHGGGHRIAPDIQGSAVQFFFDHPYEQATSPYAAGLPSSFPAYCSL